MAPPEAVSVRVSEGSSSGSGSGRHGAGAVALRYFLFTSEDIAYGFVNVGAKICEVLSDSLAGDLGVRPGWHIASIDGVEMPGAMQKLVRRAPVVTTDEVRQILRARRAEAVTSKKPVRLTFWTQPLPFRIEREEEEMFEAETLDVLKRILVKKYGSIVAAWNEVLDTDGSGEVSYTEFLAACRAAGVHGNLGSVFREMDKDDSGQITIKEFDPTFAMDFSRGRCIVCTLPNPCEAHDAQTQRAVAEQRRDKLEHMRLQTE
eukprot:TRINITY_DN19634_c0_g1_i1.p1 TRINITY_DN19634_c0_g1~~TRINITY_DN19634_c0_g1_i1.p1  ORF type:complete len:261 (+),score=46.87 TRINITY_DN19634_c0_g1_i1:73-855(+)